ncbi:MAG: DUF1501 domain-containing protein [Leeuwenhoekiella sp.]
MCETKHTKNTYGKHQKLDRAHDVEHEKWSRRSFMQMLGLAGSGTVMLGGAAIAANRPAPLTAALYNNDSDHILVLIRLKGGNDGLSTIVPIFDYDRYAQARPTIKLAENSLYKLNPDFGIPESLSSLQAMWGEGAMRVANNVGYADQNLSHFKSSDIWATGDVGGTDPTGFLGKYFQGEYPDFLTNPPQEPAAIQIGSLGNLLFQGDESNYAFALSDPDQLAQVAESGALHDVTQLPGCTYGDQLGFIRGTINSTLQYSEILHSTYLAGKNNADYERNSFSNQLAIIARMIKGGLKTKIYMITLNGFDTHANQPDRHSILMNRLSKAVSAFYSDLKSSGDDKRVLSMTFSEFGRRLEENGSNGTDHGAASPVLFFGSGLNGNGFLGGKPDLQDLEGPGNLKHAVDFRALYANVLQDWLCVPQSTVQSLFPGVSLTDYDLGFSCEGLGGQRSARPVYEHYASYSNGETFINFTPKSSGRVKVVLYNLLGQQVATLYDAFTVAGFQQFEVRRQAGELSSGQYIYAIEQEGRRYSKTFLLK